MHHLSTSRRQEGGQCSRQIGNSRPHHLSRRPAAPPPFAKTPPHSILAKAPPPRSARVLEPTHLLSLRVVDGTPALVVLVGRKRLGEVGQRWCGRPKTYPSD